MFFCSFEKQVFDCCRMNSLAERMFKPARGHDSWIGLEVEAQRIERGGRDSSMLVVESDSLRLSASPSQPSNDTASNEKLGFGERAFSAAGAAFLSAVIVNPLDVAKVMLNQSSLLLFTCYILELSGNNWNM